MQKFQIQLKNGKIKTYSTLLYLFIVLQLAFFIVLSFTSLDKNIGRITLTYVIIIISANATAFAAWKKDRQYRVRIGTVASIIIMHLILQFWLAAVAVLIIAILYGFAVRDLLVQVDENDITYPSVPKNKFSWAELNNIIAKDGILTIDLKTNKMMQAEMINTENDQMLDEKEFNDFCKEQLKTHGS